MSPEELYSEASVELTLLNSSGCSTATTLRLRIRKVEHMAVIQLHRCKWCGKTWFPPESWHLKICPQCRVARALLLSMRKVEHAEVIQMHRCDRCGKAWFPRTRCGEQTEAPPALSPRDHRTMMCQQCANVESDEFLTTQLDQGQRLTGNARD